MGKIILIVWKKKTSILGYTKVQIETDFGIMGTPIMASGDGKVTKAGWCGGGETVLKLNIIQLIKQYMHICQNLVGV